MSRASDFISFPKADGNQTAINAAIIQRLLTYDGSVGNVYGLDKVVRFKDLVALDPISFESIKRSSATSRITRITGNIIRLGKIESNDSATYLDLDNDKLVFNAKVNYASSMPGIFIGKDDDGTYKFNMGYPSTGELKFDGNNVSLLIGPTPGNSVLIDGENVRVRSSNYASGSMGSGFSLSPDLLEVGNIACRGIFRTVVFQKETLSSISGGLVISKGSDVLATDMTAADASTLIIEGNETFAVGDFLRIKDGSNDEWLEVANADSAPTYVVARDKNGDYAVNTNPVWTKGASVVNFVASGDGAIQLTASEEGAPFISVITHAGSPWDTLTTKVRVGNLNGFLGYATDLYGIAIGESTKYLKYDSTNGLRIKGTITGSDITLDTGGFIKTSGKDGYADDTAGFFLGYTQMLTNLTLEIRPVILSGME